MTPEERQALREWHKPYDINGMEYCKGCRDNDTGYEADGPHYPCDVIQVLDALDKTWKGLGVLADAGLAAVGAYNELALQPCPKCGEKL